MKTKPILLDDLKRADKYFLMTSTIVPRPIAVVATLNEDRTDNLAAFSYFNAVSSEPPCVMFSVTSGKNGKKKDTLINIEREKEFIIHIANSRQMNLVDQTGESLPYGVSEREKLGLTQVSSTWIKTPRVKEFSVAMECKLERIIEIGGSNIVFGRIIGMHIDESLLLKDPNSGDTIPRADSHALDPLARMDRNYGKIVPIESNQP